MVCTDGQHPCGAQRRAAEVLRCVDAMRADGFLANMPRLLPLLHSPGGRLRGFYHLVYGSPSRGPSATPYHTCARHQRAEVRWRRAKTVTF